MRFPVAIAIILLAALTWLSFRGLNPEAKQYDHALATLDRFNLAERALQRDILRARAGSLRNFDPLVLETRQLHSALSELRGAVSGKRSSDALRNLLASLEKQEEYTEEFKSKIALLRNSLAYFSLFSGRIDIPEQGEPSLPIVNALSAAMLRLSLDTGSANASEVSLYLQKLSDHPEADKDSQTVKALLSHGRLLRDLLPTSDRILATIFALPIEAEEEALRSALVGDQISSRDAAQTFRLVGFVISVLLLGTLIRLGFLLRSRAQSLRWRAGIEHIVADISTKLIACTPEETDACIKDALHRLARYVGADRAYFVCNCRTQHAYTWSRGDRPFPPNWPFAAIALARDISDAQDNFIHLRHNSDFDRDDRKGILRRLGIRSWVCIEDPRRGLNGSLIGFDGIETCISAPSSDLRLLRMAFDAIFSTLDRNRLFRARSLLEDELHQVKRVQTLGTFASGVAHNFNNIINSILGYVEITEPQIRAKDPAAKGLAEIRQAGLRARDLVEQLLTFGQRRSSKYRPIALDTIVTEAESFLSVSLPEKIALIVRQRDNPTVIGDPAQLQQVVLNLAHNAAQSMDGAGRIEMDISVRDTSDAVQTNLGELEKGRYAVIAISDRGAGITPVVMSQLFEPFFTTRPTGHGLGLATASSIVRVHNGAINVRSEPGVGSCFEIWLPCQVSEYAAPRTQIQRSDISGCGEIIMVIEELSTRLLRDEEVLAALGYEPIGFSSVSEAEAALKADPDRFDAVVIGYMASNSKLLTLATTLARVAPGKPLVAAVQSGRDIPADDCVASGISGIVRWPLVPSEVAFALSKSMSALHDVDVFNCSL